MTIISDITYRPGFKFLVGEDGDRMYVQMEVSVESEFSLSPFTHQREAWKSGKAFLSMHMCRQEIVGAVFGVIRSAEEHEMREWFKYKGASIYNPHLDPDALADVARRKSSYNFRKNAMSMDEA
tara:strand:- start:378 stop:749 length:372 start_codon:yes stop_codon:yes gene_type:complete